MHKEADQISCAGAEASKLKRHARSMQGCWVSRLGKVSRAAALYIGAANMCVDCGKHWSSSFGLQGTTTGSQTLVFLGSAENM
jgi:hypothetical protein